MALNIETVLGADVEDLLAHQCKTIPKEKLHLPGPDFIDRVTALSDRPVQVLRNLAWLYRHGRLGGSGYISLLPVDQGVEHSGGSARIRKESAPRTPWSIIPPCNRATERFRS